MATIAKVTNISLVSILLLGIIWSCANQLGPQGGEVDKIPPEVIHTFPDDRTTNYSENYIELEFSEYVDKRSVQDAIFISPNIEGNIDYDWSGTSLEITFEDSLQKDFTYTITVGTEVIDLNNRNKMASAFSFTFSTGPEIDYCSVTGKVYDKDPSGTFLFAYQLNDTIPNPVNQKPVYVSQAGKDGNYSIMGMAPAKYRIFAIKDSFADLLYNTGDDNYGCPFQDIVLTKTDSLFSGLDYKLTLEDTLEAHLNEITMTDRNHILVEFNEAVDSTRLSTDNFAIVDSTTMAEHSVKMLYKSSGKTGSYFITFSDSLVEENNNYLTVRNIYDRFGNLLNEETASFVVATKPDTVAPKVKSVDSEYAQSVVDFLNPYLILNFDDGITPDSLSEALTLTDEEQVKLDFDIVTIDNASFRINIANTLEPKKDFELSLLYSLIPDAAGNSLDTFYTSKFSTINELDFSGLSGTVIGGTNIVIEIMNITTPGVKYNQPVDSLSSFKFDRVRPGDYLISCFSDINKNDKFDYGTVNPFGYSEKFVYYPDTLKLAARWPVGDVSIEFDNSN